LRRGRLASAAAAALLILASVSARGQEPGSGGSGGAAAAPAVRILSPTSADVPAGDVRVEAAVDGFQPGDELDVFADGRKIATLTAPPWAVQWPAGQNLRRHEVTVALRRRNREISKAHVRTRDVGFSSAAGAHAVGVSPIVTDGSGHFVPGLTQRDFSILEDGVPQTIETFDAADSPLAAILVLDISESMTPKLDDARRAAHAFVDSLKPEDEIGLYTFNSAIVGAIDLTRNRAAIHSAIDEAQPAGETALYDVTASALRRLKSIKRRKAVVLFTDGEDNRSRLSVDQIVEIARASEASIFSVAQGTDEAKTLRVYLNKLADETGGRSYFIGSIRKLHDVFRQILTELKSQYFMTYTPREIRHGSWHRIDVRVGRPSVTVRAKKEYYLE